MFTLISKKLILHRLFPFNKELKIPRFMIIFFLLGFKVGKERETSPLEGQKKCPRKGRQIICWDFISKTYIIGYKPPDLRYFL